MQNRESTVSLISNSLLAWFWIFVAIFAIAAFCIAINAINRIQNQNGIPLNITSTTYATLGSNFCNNRAIVQLPNADITSTPSARLPKCPANATVEFIPGSGSLDGSLTIINVNGTTVPNTKDPTTIVPELTRGRSIVCTNAGPITGLAQDWSCLATEALSTVALAKIDS